MKYLPLAIIENTGYSNKIINLHKVPVTSDGIDQCIADYFCTTKNFIKATDTDEYGRICGSVTINFTILDY